MEFPNTGSLEIRFFGMMRRGIFIFPVYNWEDAVYNDKVKRGNMSFYGISYSVEDFGMKQLIFLYLGTWILAVLSQRCYPVRVLNRAHLILILFSN